MQFSQQLKQVRQQIAIFLTGKIKHRCLSYQDLGIWLEATDQDFLTSSNQILGHYGITADNYVSMKWQ